MIRFVRPSVAPRALAEHGPAKTRALVDAFASDPASYMSGRLSLSADHSVYAHTDVKAALVAMQRGKCFMCESHVKITSHGDVEHFRPKGGVQQEPGVQIERPGYYWLSYDWENLFLSCEVCNQSFKRNLFPLLNPAERARSPEADIGRELPVFIDPAREDPAQFIAFRGTELYAIDDNERGRKTIEWLGLNRDALAQAREAHYKRLKCLHDVVHHLPRVSADLRTRAANALSRDLEDDAPYLSMVRAAAEAAFDTRHPVAEEEVGMAPPPPRTHLRRRRF